MNSLKALALASVVLAGGSTSLASQAVVMPRTTRLDSTQVTIQRAIYVLRDSLKFVDAANARIARDLRTTSDAAIRSRGRHMSERCAAAARTAPITRTAVSEAARPAPDPQGLRLEMEQALQALTRQLHRCRIDFEALAAPERSQEFRDYGIGRGARVREAIKRYEDVLRRYYPATIGDRYLPDFRGAGATPGTSPS